MSEVTCADCDAPHDPNGFLTGRGWVCRDCATDPENPNVRDDFPTLGEIDLS